MRRRIGSWLRTAIAVCACALLAPLLQPASPARADDPPAEVSVTVDSLTPSLPKDDDPITISGTVKNTSKQDLYSLQAYFWRSRDPITNAEGMTQILQSDADQPTGSRVFDSRTCGPVEGKNLCFQNLYEDDQPILAPGESAKFSVTATAAQLDLPKVDGVYLIGIQVRGTTDGSANYSVVGRTRLFAPMLQEGPSNSLQMTSIVMLNSRPSMPQDDIFTDEHLLDEIKEGGRLDRLLSAADRPKVSYAIDPALIDELEHMKDGYQVLGKDGSTSDGTGQKQAAAWLDRFADLPAGQDGYRLPFATPDLAALVNHGQGEIGARSERAAGAVSQVADLPLLAYGSDGQADAPTLQAYNQLDPAAVLLSDSATNGRGPLLTSGTGQDGAPIVTYSSRAFSGGPGPDPRETAVHQRQRLLADTWVEATNGAEDSTLGRVRVITNPREANSDAVAQQAPWMRQTTLSELLRSKPSSWSEELDYPPAAQDAQLSIAALENVSLLAQEYSVYADLLADPEDEAAQADAALARAASTWWRTTRAGGNFRHRQRETLNTILKDKVTLATNPLLRLTSADLQQFPMTVTNDLGVPVNVKIRFTSSNSQRLTVRQVGKQTVKADETIQLNGKARARANGPGELTAQLITVSEEAPIGPPVTIEVKANNVGVIGWVIVGAAGIVLIGTTALRIRKVRRLRAKAAHD